jgi:ribosome biogenesis GTPase / thiamine phosphate phosphatase
MSTTSKATVTASFGRFCTLRLASGEQVNAYAKGKRSDVVCGDEVQVSRSGDEAVIERVEARRNSLFRQDETRTKVFAANLDQVLFMVAGKPTFNDDLLGRAMMACHVAQVPVVIALNKRELPEAAAARERLKLYTQLGYSVVECSAKPDMPQAAVTQEDWLAPIKAVLQGKTTLVLGGSGVGKSTLINALVPDAKAATQVISEALNSGKHTTTATLAYQLNESSVLMDSPGFQTFGLQHLSASQLADAMPEFHTAREQRGGCKFYNCTHLREPGCAVLAAMAQGEIAPSRHALYAQVLAELGQEKW